tara:strand:+ start:103 stop:351 length:249 start_codon:yes stop_codon:yes gene_type:complete
MKITRPRPQGRAFDVNGTMIKTGEIGVFDEATIARAPHWFEPAPEPPKPKPKPKAAKTDKPKAKATKKSTKKAIKRSTTEPK